jgi:maltose alpha-D-glucosyltransferase/alpha-amylase
MHYVEGLTSVEGGYERTGSRSPMAWNKEKNAGFSDADEKDLYIPQDTSKNLINVETEKADPESILNEVRQLIAIRKKYPALENCGDFKLLEPKENSAYPLVYERAELSISDYDVNGACEEKIIVLLNPSGREAQVYTPLPDNYKVIYAVGGLKGKSVLPQQANAIFMPPASAAFIAFSSESAR